jgi:hypothetical protein
MHDLQIWLELLQSESFRGFTLLWLALALWVVLVLLRPSAALVLRRNEGGQLHRLVEACAEQLKGVVHARARVWRRRGKFHTVLHLKVRPQARLDAIQGYLEQEVRDIFAQNLGLPDSAGRVEIKVVGVVAEPTGF